MRTEKTKAEAASLAGTSPSTMEDIFSENHHLRLVSGDLRAYRQFRSQEQSLVSAADHDNPDAVAPLTVLVPTYRDTPLGAVSYLVSANGQRPPINNRYARIDLVIAGKAYQGIGLGRLLLESAITQVLREEGERLYSISCLAAHPAIAAVLEQLGFEGETRAELEYTIEKLDLVGVDVAALEADFTRQTTDTVKRVHYMLRQRETGA